MPCREWVFADMGILCAGGVSSGIYPTDSSAQVEYLVNDSATKVIFAEDEEQLDKILACRARCPTLQRIVVFDMEGLSGFGDRYGDVARRIHGARAQSPGRAARALWDEMIAKAEAPAISPSSSIPRAPRGRPRGAMHSNRGVTHQMRHANDLVSVHRQRRARWCSCRSATSPNGSAAITSRWRSGR